MLGALLAVAVALQTGFLVLSLYQAVVTIAGWRPRRGRITTAPEVAPPVRFGILVCARNEENIIGTIVRGLLRQEYPQELVRVVVVAHNCSDDTAAMARKAGALVVEAATERPGKGQAILAGLPMVADTEMVGVFDADSRVPRQLLATVAAAAADGEACIQVETRPLPVPGRVAEGYAIGRRARNLLWWRPREVLGLGTTVSGSGWFIRPALLREVITDCRTLTEDLEVSARLYARGKRVRYLSAGYVRMEEPDDLAASVRQRARWVRGHFGVVRHEAGWLLLRSLRGNLRSLDMLFYLLTPSRVITRSAATASLGVAVFAPAWGPPVWLAGPAFAGEWVLPALVVGQAGVLPRNFEGFKLAVRTVLLSLLWFPIGVWGLLTPSKRSWHQARRVAPPEGEIEALE